MGKMPGRKLPSRDVRSLHKNVKSDRSLPYSYVDDIGFKGTGLRESTIPGSQYQPLKTWDETPRTVSSGMLLPPSTVGRKFQSGPKTLYDQESPLLGDNAPGVSASLRLDDLVRYQRMMTDFLGESSPVDPNIFNSSKSIFEKIENESQSKRAGYTPLQNSNVEVAGKFRKGFKSENGKSKIARGHKKRKKEESSNWDQNLVEDTAQQYDGKHDKHESYYSFISRLQRKAYDEYVRTGQRHKKPQDYLHVVSYIHDVTGKKENDVSTRHLTTRSLVGLDSDWMTRSRSRVTFGDITTPFPVYRPKVNDDAGPRIESQGLHRGKKPQDVEAGASRKLKAALINKTSKSKKGPNSRLAKHGKTTAKIKKRQPDVRDDRVKGRKIINTSIGLNMERAATDKGHCSGAGVFGMRDILKRR